MGFETGFIANREVRRIPRGWQHPKDERGKYLPLLDRGYYAELVAEGAEMKVGQMPEVTGLAPEANELVAYETTTEGTPSSPAFPDTPEGRVELVRYCAKHATTFGDYRADVEAWAGMLFSDHIVLVDPTTAAFASPETGRSDNRRPAPVPAFSVVSRGTMAESCDL